MIGNVFQNITLRRIVSRLIDILLPSLTSVIGYYVVTTSFRKDVYSLNKVVSITFFIWFFYIVTIIVSLLIAKGRTLGDFFMKIQLVTVKEERVHFLKILLRELYFSIFILGALLFTNGWVGLLLNIIPLGKFKNWGHIVIPIDLIFGLKYINLE